MANYEVKVVQVIPDISKVELNKNKKCYLGISINNPIFWRSSLDTIIRWMSDNFEECIIIIGDYLHRHNEEMFTGKIKSEAIELALKKGDELFNRVKNAVMQQHKAKFQVVRWKEYFANPNYSGFKDTLDYCYKTDSKFKKAIDSTANDFISKQLERGSQIESNGAELSVQYILEEMAVFCVLIQQGYKVEIYPGPELPVFKMISENLFPLVPEILKNRINIEIRVLK